MQPCKITFGLVPEGREDEAEEIAEDYLASLCCGGQVCGEQILAVSGHALCAYAQLAGVDALAEVHHSNVGLKMLREVSAFFSTPPVCELLEDDLPDEYAAWEGAPSLFLFAHMFNWAPPLCRGDDCIPVPSYRFPIHQNVRESIYFWQCSYRNHDAIWLDSRDLEIPSYKQLAVPSSGLAERGRTICRAVEKATGIPVYYYLMRYWGRRQGEQRRRCPGCGGAWRTSYPLDDSAEFWHFPFRCETCRLVSHAANSNEDERHAVFGEWRPPK